jgi:hypothetical protein
MLRAGEKRQVKSDHLIANQLVDERIGIDESAGRHSVKAVHKLPEIETSHRFRQPRGPPNVHEEKRKLDFRSTRVRQAPLHTMIAEPRVSFVRASAYGPHQGCAQSFERGATVLASLRGRKQPEEPTVATPVVTARQRGVPDVLSFDGLEVEFHPASKRYAFCPAPAG